MKKTIFNAATFKCPDISTWWDGMVKIDNDASVIYLRTDALGRDSIVLPKDTPTPKCKNGVWGLARDIKRAIVIDDDNYRCYFTTPGSVVKESKPSFVTQKPVEALTFLYGKKVGELCE